MTYDCACAPGWPTAPSPGQADWLLGSCPCRSLIGQAVLTDVLRDRLAAEEGLVWLAAVLRVLGEG